jgi:hypothetical protein
LERKVFHIKPFDINKIHFLSNIFSSKCEDISGIKFKETMAQLFYAVGEFRIYFICSSLKMEAAGASETLQPIYQPTYMNITSQNIGYADLL